MLMAVGLLVALGVMLIVISRRASGFKVVRIIAETVLVAVASWVIWSVLLMNGVVHVDPLLRSLGVNRLDQPWAAMLFLMPPIIIAVVFGFLATSTRKDRG